MKIYENIDLLSTFRRRHVSVFCSFWPVRANDRPDRPDGPGHKARSFLLDPLWFIKRGWVAHGGTEVSPSLSEFTNIPGEHGMMPQKKNDGIPHLPCAMSMFSIVFLRVCYPLGMVKPTRHWTIGCEASTVMRFARGEPASHLTDLLLALFTYWYLWRQILFRQIPVVSTGNDGLVYSDGGNIGNGFVKLDLILEAYTIGPQITDDNCIMTYIYI